jgi:branched-chain amino acid transport system substrate-binding protein
MRNLWIIMAAVFVIAGCGEKDMIITVGGLFPLTGNAATFGQSSRNGMQLAVDEIDADGGVKIKGAMMLIKAVYEDDEGAPEKAANACQKLISQNNVSAIIGAVMSKNSLAIAPICQASGIPMISPASTNVKVTEAGNYIFRACFIDPFQGAVMAKYAYNNLGSRKAAIIFDNGNDYNKGLSEIFKATFIQLGGKVVAEEAFTDEASTVDFKAQLTNIKAAAPDFLYSPNYYAADATIMKQAHEIGLNVPTGGGDGWDSPQLMEIGGKDVEGCVFSNHFSKDDTSRIVAAFVTNYRKAYGADPDALASLAYDATVILIKAMKSAGSVNGAALRDAIKTQTVQGVSGKITFDEKRNPIKTAVILKILNGKQTYITTINP